jgi:transcriptional regulator with XRE-family HTH domain
LVVARKTSNTPRFPVEYGKYLEQRAKAAGLDRHALVRLTGLDYNTIYRNFAGKPQRSILSANKIRDVIVARGVAVDPVPSETDDWQPGKGRGNATQPPPIDDPLRRNLVNFREEVGLDLHEAAKETGIPLELLRAYELGEQAVSGLHLIELAKTYGRPAEHFDQPNPPPRASPPRPRVKAMAFGDISKMPPEIQARVRDLERQAIALTQMLQDEARRQEEAAKHRKTRR